MVPFGCLPPIQLTRHECLFCRRIGNTFSAGWIVELRKPGEFISSPLPDKLCEFGLEVAKKGKGLIGSELLSHEHHRDLRQQQVDRDDCADRVRRGKRRNPVSERAVAYL